ncbi:pyridoxamine 5'-phosphate oxidase family protein [Blastococcus sp. SYSU DS1024]
MTSAAHLLEVIPVEECYALLADHKVGRIGVIAEHHPLIIPVNYGMDGRSIVIRTHPVSTLTAAEHANVTFEVDEIDRATRTGWNVLVRGLADTPMRRLGQVVGAPGDRRRRGTGTEDGRHIRVGVPHLPMIGGNRCPCRGRPGSPGASASAEGGCP